MTKDRQNVSLDSQDPDSVEQLLIVIRNITVVFSVQTTAMVVADGFQKRTVNRQ